MHKKCSAAGVGRHVSSDEGNEGKKPSSGPPAIGDRAVDGENASAEGQRGPADALLPGTATHGHPSDLNNKLSRA
jgi:hypothetical protein